MSSSFLTNVELNQTFHLIKFKCITFSALFTISTVSQIVILYESNYLTANATRVVIRPSDCCSLKMSSCSDDVAGVRRQT